MNQHCETLSFCSFIVACYSICIEFLSKYVLISVSNICISHTNDKEANFNVHSYATGDYFFQEDNVVRSRIVYRVPSNWINFVVNNKFSSRATRTSFPCENRSIHIFIWRRDIF